MIAPFATVPTVIFYLTGGKLTTNVSLTAVLCVEIIAEYRGISILNAVFQLLKHSFPP